MRPPTGTFHPPSHPEFGRISVDAIEPAAYREILRAWCAQRGDRPFPSRQQIDPFVVPALTANIILFEVRDDTIVYRVLGEKVIMATKGDLRGKTPQEAFGDTPYIRMVEQQLLACAASGTPFYSCHDFPMEDSAYGGHSRKAWRIALPYGDDGRVSRLLCYQRLSQAIETYTSRDIDYAKLLPKSVFMIEL